MNLIEYECYDEEECQKYEDKSNRARNFLIMPHIDHEMGDRKMPESVSFYNLMIQPIQKGLDGIKNLFDWNPVGYAAKNLNSQKTYKFEIEHLITLLGKQIWENSTLDMRNYFM